MIYTTKDKAWTDNNGYQIPLTKIGKVERFKEKAAGSLLKDALAIQEQLKELKEKFVNMCEESYKLSLAAVNAQSKERKGNYTFYSYDKTVRVERTIQENISFESVLIAEAKNKIDELLSDKLSAIDGGIAQWLLDAFKTRNNQLDPKKVLDILSRKSTIKYKLFQEACECIEKSIQRTYSATYYRIATQNPEGKYDYIDLNFSSI